MFNCSVGSVSAILVSGVFENIDLLDITVCRLHRPSSAFGFASLSVCVVLPLIPHVFQLFSLQGFTDMMGDSMPLAALGVSHGDMVFMLVGEERQVEPAYKKGLFEGEHQ